MNLNFTEKEQKMVNAHFIIAEEQCGRLKPEDLIWDNLSCAYVEDFERLTGFSKHQIAGLIGSLIEKGFMNLEERSAQNGRDLYWINDTYLEEITGISIW